MTTKVTITDLQFSASTPTEEKLRRLMDDLRKMQRAINNMVDEITSLTQSGGSVAPHVLATTVGLGPDHTVSELTPGQVLIANSPTNALFRKIQFGDIDGTDFGTPANGDVIRYIDGYFTYASLPGLASISDPGSDAILTWSGALSSLTWRMTGTGLDMNAGTLYVVPSEIDHGSLAGLLDDDHPRYTEHAAVETITASWTFNEVTTFGDDISVTGDITQVGDLSSMTGTEPLVEWRDSGASIDAGGWRWHVSDGQLTLSTLDDVGGEGETALRIGRIQEQIDSLDFSGDAMTFNGADVLTAESTSSTATAGAATLPANPVAFVNVLIDGSPYKLPYYAP